MEGPPAASGAAVEVDQVMKGFADATEEALGRGDLAAAETAMSAAIAHERARGGWVAMVNLEMDLLELLAAGGGGKKKTALRKQIAKDRNDLFPAPEKELLRKLVPERIAAAQMLEGGAETVLDALETTFQEARAFFGDADEAVVAVREAIAGVFMADENYVDALSELREIGEPSFGQLKQMLECQMKLAGFGEIAWGDCLETLRLMKERFGKSNGDEIESAAAFVLFKDGKLQESLKLYQRVIARGKGNVNDAKTLCAHVLMDLEKHDEAIEMVRSADKTSRTAYLLAKIYHTLKRLDDSQAAIQEMQALLAPEDVPGLITCRKLEGLVLFDQRKPQEALAKLEEAVELCKKIEDDNLIGGIYDDMGMIYNALDDKENTLKYFELARQYDDEEEDDEDDSEGDDDDDDGDEDDVPKVQKIKQKQ